MFKLKIAQMISYLLSLNGNKMNLLKLMKELYLSDRLSIEERDTSISGDVYFSMNHGPVLSATLNLIRNGEFKNYFSQTKVSYFPDLILKQTAGDSFLSAKDKEYLKAISDQFKNASCWELEEYTHKLPEWKDPSGSSTKIRYQDIMRALGRSEEEIAEAKKEYDQICNFNKQLGN